MTKRRFVVPALVVVGFLGLGLTGCGKKLPKASNRIVILLDGSVSFKKRQMAAVARTSALLESMSKQEVHRWEKGTDHIVLISLDSAPAVVWQGNLPELKTSIAEAPTVWADRLRARADYARCTDVNAAFQLAVEHLDGDPRYVKKYLFAFTDLLDEPPTTSLTACRAARSGPPENFPWEGLQDVSVSIFWMPAAQILPWKRAIASKALDSSFKLYSDSESAAVSVAPPPRPKVTLTAEEADAERHAAIGYLKTAAIMIVGGPLLLLVLALALRRFNRRNANPSTRQGTPGARPIQQPQPMPLNRRPTR